MKCASDSIPDVITALVRGICYADVQIKTDGSLTTFLPDQADHALLIGAGGKQIRALKFLAEQMALSQGTEDRIEIEDSYRGRSNPWRQPPTCPDQWFLSDRFRGIFNRFLDLLFNRKVDYTVEMAAPGEAKIRLDCGPEDEDVTKALSDAFFPFGKRYGWSIKVRRKSD